MVDQMAAMWAVWTAAMRAALSGVSLVGYLVCLEVGEWVATRDFVMACNLEYELVLMTEKN